jgi:hypothetical protein
MMEKDERLPKKTIFCDELSFHLSKKVNRHNIQIRRSSKSVAAVEIEYTIPK